MRVWVVKIGEILPIKGSNRLLRTGIIANLLAKQGNEVVWWTSTFDHFLKKQIYQDDVELVQSNNYKIVLLKGIGYKKNVSLKRLIDHKIISNKFRKRIYAEEKMPDIIVCAYPTISLAYECIRYGKKFNIPVIIDVRDLWPDIFFHELLPSRFSIPLLKISNLFFKKHIAVFKSANSIIGITEKILDWGLKYADRKRTNSDTVFYLSYEKKNISFSHKMPSLLAEKGVIFNKEIFYVCLVGTISEYKFTFEKIITAAKILFEQKTPIKFLICGEGEALADLKAKTSEITNVQYTGWINHEEISYILQNSDFGLAPYRNSYTYITSIPSKISEYFAYGLPVISSLTGELELFLAKHKAGFTYQTGEELARLLIDLVNNSASLNKIRKNNLSLYEDEFRSDNVYNKYIQHIYNIKYERQKN